jgi:P-type Ca2+ transporter type 2C
MAVTTERPWHQLEIDQLMASLETGEEGLSRDEAARRLEEHGPNELTAAEQVRPLEILLRQVKSPLIYILIAAAIVTALLGEFVDTGVILAVVVLNSVVGFIQEYRAEQALQALAKMTAPRAKVRRDGQEVEIDAAKLVPGDVVLLESGGKVPADLRLFRSVDLQVEEAILTGESLPVLKQTESIDDPHAPLGDRLNLAFMGTSVVRGRGAGVAIATGMSTAFGRIASDVQAVGEVKSPLQLRLAAFSRLIAILGLVVVAAVFLLGLAVGEPIADIFLTAVATAVAVVPEGLPVTITVALAVGVQRMARRNSIIRKLPAVETLGSTTVICSDKTGTLTRNEMTVTRIFAGGREYGVTGVGYAPDGEIHLDGQHVDLARDPQLDLTLRIGLLANESALKYEEEDGRYRAAGDPTEVALIVAAMKAGLRGEDEKIRYPTVDEIPFESDRQYMASLHEHDGRKLIFVKGAIERVLQMCESALVGGGDSTGAGSQRDGVAPAAPGNTAPLDREAVQAEADHLAEQGLRVLAMAFKRVPDSTTELDTELVESGLTFAGLQAMIDPPRPEAIEAIERCRQAGIRVAMITGDHKVTAVAIGGQMGIADEEHRSGLDGRELESMDDEELFSRVDEVNVYSRAAPHHKLRIVQQLRRKGSVVAVTGDGVNDASALKQADIGIAMGITGTDVAKESSDMVLTDDNFASIYAAVEEGRVVFDNVRKVIIFLIPTGIGLVLTVVGSIVLGIPLPFLPAQVIWINLVTNAIQDVAMAFEPAEEDVGRRKPRDPKEGILTRPMIERTALVGLVLMLGTLGIFIWQIETGSTLEYARAVAMTTMVLFQNFHIFNSRSFDKSAFRLNPLTNRLLLGGIIAALGLHILALYWGPLQAVLRLVPLDGQTWLGMVAVAASVLVVVEIDKAIRRWRR